MAKGRRLADLVPGLGARGDDWAIWEAAGEIRTSAENVEAFAATT